MKPPHDPKKFGVFWLGLNLLLLAASPLNAQTTWSTTPTDGQMTNGGNWQGSVVPVDSTPWTFTNSSVTSLTNGFSSYTVTGILFTTNASTYTMGGNAFALTGGITNISIATQTINNALTINSSVVLTNAANSTTSFITLGGAITGSGTITYGAANANGRLTLNGNNTNFAGALITTSGRVNIGNSNAVSAKANYTFNNSGNVYFATANSTYQLGSLASTSTTTTLQGNGGTITNFTLEIGANLGAGSSATFAGSIGGATASQANFSLSKAGAGTQILTGTNLYSQNTTIKAGTLQIGAGGTVGSISNTTNISLDGGWLAFNRSDNLAQGVNFLTNSAIISGTNTSGGLVQAGSGTLTLTAANTFSGTTRVDAGKLVLSNNSAIQNSAFDTASAGVLSLASGITTPTLGGLIGSGAFAPENYASVTALTLNTATGANLTYSGVISNGAAGMTLTKSGAGTQTLSGNNSYSGGTTLNAGTLGVGHSSALGSGALTVGGTSTLLAAADALTLANDVALNSGTLTVDAQSFTLTNAGTISGTGALAKAGAGTLVLTGNNSYNGGTTLSNGTLAVNTANSLGDASGALTFAGVSTLRADASFTTARNYALSAAATIDTTGNNLTNTGVISGSGANSLTKAGNGTLSLNGANTYSSATVISGGVLTIGDAGQLNSGSYAAPITNNGTAFNYASSANQTLSGAVSGTGALLKANTGTLTLTGNNSYTGKTTVSGGTLAVGGADNRLGTAPGSFVADQLTLDGGTLGVIGNLTFSVFRGTTLGSSGGTFNVSTNVTLAIGTGSVISGSGALTKTGDGTLSLTASSTYSGGTILSAGTTRVGVNAVANASGAFGVGDLTLQDGIKLTTTGSANIALNAPTLNLLGNVTLNEATGTGSGALQISAVWDLGGGSRTITVQRTNSSFGSGGEGLKFSSAYTNPIIQNGSLTLASDTSATAAAPSVVSFNTATFTTNSSLTVGDGVTIVAASGSFFTTGSGAPALTLQADGGRGSGVLQLGYGTAVRSAEVYSLAGGGLVTGSFVTNGSTYTNTLTINNGNGADFSGTITDGGPGAVIRLTKSGSGTQILSGNNSYSGATTVSAGALIVNGDQSSATGNLTVASGAILGGSGTLGSLSNSITGSIRPGNSIGTLTVNGDTTWNAGNAWVFELGGAAPTLAGASTSGSTQDLLAISGAGSDFLKGSGSGWTFDFANTGSLGYYQLVTWGGTTTFAATDFTASNLASGYTGEFTIQDSALYVQVVPEPSTYALLGLAAMGFGAHILRRRKH